jgi:hypothetical protein
MPKPKRGHNDSDPIMQRLMGRIEYLHLVGRVKDPELMLTAYEFLSELMDAGQGAIHSKGSDESLTRIDGIINRIRGTK